MSDAIVLCVDEDYSISAVIGAEAPPPEVAEWTFMVYLDGDNNLEPAAIEDFLEMASVGSTNEVNIIAQFDRAGYDSSYDGWTDCKRFFIEKDIGPWPQKAVQDLGEVNMADPNTLNDFITWAETNYPADHCCLILWNHGSGCIRSEIYGSPTPPKKGHGLRDVCWDESHGDYMSMVELKQALSGAHLDIIGFDACLMGMVEVVYQIKDHTDYVVASEAVTLGGGCPYDTILTDLTSDPFMNGETLSSVIVNRYEEYWTSPDRRHETATMSAVNAGRLGSLGLAVDTLAQQLIDHLQTYEYEIRRSIGDAESYFNYIFIDLYHFAQSIKERVPNAVVQSAADNVTVILDETVISEWHYPTGHRNSHGLSIYFTRQDHPSRYYNTKYDDLDFAKETSWDEFTRTYAILDWPTFHHDLGHVGRSPSPAPKTNTTLWSYQTGGPIHSSPAVVDGVVFIGSSDRYVYALNRSTGELVWSYGTDGPVLSSPAVADGMVFVGSGDNKIYALDELTGILVWSYETGGPVHSSPAIANGLVYIGSQDGNIYAIDEFTGELNWTRSETVMLGLSSPAIHGVQVFIGSADGRICVFLFNGEYFYGSWQIGDWIDSSPAIAHGTVFVGSNDGRIYAFGGFEWNYTTDSPVGSSPAVADSMVFIGSNDSRVYALDEFNGEPIWSYETGGPVLSSPAVADGMVFVGSGDNKIYALDELSGTVIWRYQTGGSVYSSPAVANGMVFVGSCDGRIYAFGQPCTEGWHDISITNVETYKTVTIQNVTTSINVTVQNEGTFEETFNVTLYCDSSEIGAQTAILSSWHSTVLTFEWTTPTELGDYTIRAEAGVVENETDVEDNSLVFGIIKISILGDIDGNGKVNILDVAMAAVAFGSKLGDDNWNPNADMDENKTINIIDIAQVAVQFGKTA